jgi:uncharacterized protein
MLKAFLRLLIPAAALFLASAGGGVSPAAAQETFARSSVLIETAGGGKFRFNVEMAETMAQQAQGLMFRRQMAADAGMMFPYAAPQVAAFWMKNTFIPLDMLFIAADGRISHIHPNAAPQSEASIPSKGPVKAVLELNGGLAARLGVRVGDVVRHALFGNAS